MPEGAAESAIKANPVSPDTLIAGTNGPGIGQKMHFSFDGGKTWKETSLPLGGTCCDPTIEWSSDGKLAYAATLGGCTFSGCGVWFYRSGDQGQTWTDLQKDTPGDPRRELTLSGSDKEFLHVDKHATSPQRDNIYLTWHQANVMKFARSTDRGNTWTTPAISFDNEPRGIGSDITSDKNGHVYYVWAATNDRRIVVKKSTDGGVNWAAGVKVADTNGGFDFPIPAMESRRAWIYATADTICPTARMAAGFTLLGPTPLRRRTKPIHKPITRESRLHALPMEVRLGQLRPHMRRRIRIRSIVLTSGSQ